MEAIKIYIDFIKLSQSFMAGYNPIIVFIKSLYKGIGYTKEMLKWAKMSEQERLIWYVNR